MHIISHNLLSYERMYTSHELPPLVSSCTLFPTTYWAMNVCELTLAISHPHRSRTCTVGWGAWRMLWRVRERSRSSSHSQLWVARPLSPYNVFIYLFCTELLLYSKGVTFDHVPWFIICVRLGLSTPGDYVRTRVLVPRNFCVTIFLCIYRGGGLDPLQTNSLS
jgi:hypothetical protein